MAATAQDHSRWKDLENANIYIVFPIITINKT